MNRVVYIFPTYLTVDRSTTSYLVASVDIFMVGGHRIQTPPRNVTIIAKTASIPMQAKKVWLGLSSVVTEVKSQHTKNTISSVIKHLPSISISSPFGCCPFVFGGHGLHQLSVIHETASFLEEK